MQCWRATGVQHALDRDRDVQHCVRSEDVGRDDVDVEGVEKDVLQVRLRLGVLLHVETDLRAVVELDEVGERVLALELLHVVSDEALDGLVVVREQPVAQRGM